MELKELAPETPTDNIESNPTNLAVFEDDNLTVVAEQMLTDAGFTLHSFSVTATTGNVSVACQGNGC